MMMRMLLDVGCSDDLLGQIIAVLFLARYKTIILEDAYMKYSTYNKKLIRNHPVKFIIKFIQSVNDT
jgi:hypothetical protein